MSDGDGAACGPGAPQLLAAELEQLDHAELKRVLLSLVEKDELLEARLRAAWPDDDGPAGPSVRTAAPTEHKSSATPASGPAAPPGAKRVTVYPNVVRSRGVAVIVITKEDWEQVLDLIAKKLGFLLPVSALFTEDGGGVTSLEQIHSGMKLVAMQQRKPVFWTPPWLKTKDGTTASHSHVVIAAPRNRALSTSEAPPIHAPDTEPKPGHAGPVEQPVSPVKPAGHPAVGPMVPYATHTATTANAAGFMGPPRRTSHPKPSRRTPEPHRPTGVPVSPAKRSLYPPVAPSPPRQRRAAGLARQRMAGIVKPPKRLAATLSSSATSASSLPSPHPPTPSSTPPARHKSTPKTRQTEPERKLKLLAKHLIVDVTVGGVIGGGHYGRVSKGDWLGTPVALKIAHASDQDILEEAEMLQRLRHPHIINFYGLFAAPDQDAFYMVTEWANLGDCQDYVRAHPDLPLCRALEIAEQLAAGMRYLEYLGICHRDLALRNVFLSRGVSDSSVDVKIGDFGLSKRVLFGAFIAKKQRLPFRWSAPEVLQFDQVSSAADVWSYGVCIWELFARGATPYADDFPDDAAAREVKSKVVERLLQHRFLERPPSCPPELFDVVLRCWDLDPRRRPDFSELFRVVHAMRLQEPAQSEPPDVPRGIYLGLS